MYLIAIIQFKGKKSMKSGNICISMEGLMSVHRCLLNMVILVL